MTVSWRAVFWIPLAAALALASTACEEPPGIVEPLDPTTSSFTVVLADPMTARIRDVLPELFFGVRRDLPPLSATLEDFCGAPCRELDGQTAALPPFSGAVRWPVNVAPGVGPLTWTAHANVANTLAFDPVAGTAGETGSVVIGGRWPGRRASVGFSDSLPPGDTVSYGVPKAGDSVPPEFELELQLQGPGGPIVPIDADGVIEVRLRSELDVEWNVTPLATTPVKLGPAVIKDLPDAIEAAGAGRDASLVVDWGGPLSADVSVDLTFRGAGERRKSVAIPYAQSRATLPMPAAEVLELLSGGWTVEAEVVMDSGERAAYVGEHSIIRVSLQLLFD